MKKWMIFGILALIIIGIIFVAGYMAPNSIVAKVGFSTARIKDAKACEAIDKDINPVGVTSTFTPKSPVLYIWFSWANAPRDTVIKAIWIYEARNQIITEASMVSEDMSGRGVFTLTDPSTGVWLLGDYRVDLYINDKLAKSVSFKVVS